MLVLYFYKYIKNLKHLDKVLVSVLKQQAFSELQLLVSIFLRFSLIPKKVNHHLFNIHRYFDLIKQW